VRPWWASGFARLLAPPEEVEHDDETSSNPTRNLDWKRLRSDAQINWDRLVMASAFSHAVAALSIGTCFYQPQIPKRVWVAGALCSVLPDIDVVGFSFGVHYGDFWGHRGFTHSLVFAAVLAGIATAERSRHKDLVIGRFALFGYLFLATASHGVLDAMTNGGLGVAFFSPFSNHRYFLPWRPIVVSPISVHRFFSGRGYTVLQSELLWIWVPAFVFAAAVLMLRPSARTECATD
jgi:inner membrane protein